MISPSPAGHLSGGWSLIASSAGHLVLRSGLIAPSVGHSSGEMELIASPLDDEDGAPSAPRPHPVGRSAFSPRPTPHACGLAVRQSCRSFDTLRSATEKQAGRFTSGSFPQPGRYPPWASCVFFHPTPSSAFGIRPWAECVFGTESRVQRQRHTHISKEVTNGGNGTDTGQ